MKPLATPARSAVTIVEFMIAISISVIALGAVYTGAISMQRCFVASQDFADGKKEQTRLSDYVAMDLRRADSVAIGSGGDGTLLTLFMQDYYDEEGKPRTPTITKYVHSYGDPTRPMVVRYLRGGPCIYRQEQDKQPVQVARNIVDFKATTENDGSIVNTAITFAPRYRYRRNLNIDPEGSALATTVRSTTLLRNYRKVKP